MLRDEEKIIEGIITDLSKDMSQRKFQVSLTPLPHMCLIPALGTTYSVMFMSSKQMQDWGPKNMSSTVFTLVSKLPTLSSNHLSMFLIRV